MLAGDVTLSFGPHLAFNDLPSTIKAEFTLTNARPQGLQEILAKFNVGHLRVVNIKKDYIETDREETSSSGQYFDAIFDASGNKLNEVVKVEGKSGSSQSSTTDAQIETQAMNNLKKEKEELDKLKKDKGENSEEYKKALAEFEKKKKEQVEKLKNDAKLGANNNNTPPNGNGNSNPNSGTSGTSGTSTQTTTSGTSGTSGT